MIKRINVLKEVGCFTTLQPMHGTEGDFSKFNVIYAPNAYGKSTLCDVFRSLGVNNPNYLVGRKRFESSAPQEIVLELEGGQSIRFQNNQWHDRNNCPPIYIYDERFVAENIFVGHHTSVDQRRSLYGLVIGKQSMVLKQNVDEAEKQLKDASETVNSKHNALMQLIPEGYDINTFEDLPVVDEADKKIDAVTRDLKINGQKNEKANSIKSRSNLKIVPIAEVPTDLDRVLSLTPNAVAIDAEAKIKEHLANMSQGLPINWVEKGFRSQIDAKCPHCGQDMEGLEILEAYRSLFSGELQSYKELLESTKSLVIDAFGEVAQRNLKQVFIDNEKERIWWKDVVGHEFVLPKIGDIENLLANVYQAIKSALERKEASPAGKIVLTTEESSVISSWCKKATELSEYNKWLLAINDELIEIQEDAGTIDLVPLEQNLSDLKAKKRRHEKDVDDAYVAYNSALSDRKLAQDKKTQANDALRDQSNRLFQSYGVRINELLTLFGANFQIISEGVNFGGGQPSVQLAIKLHGVRVSTTLEDATDPSKPSLMNTLSGGDRSALALSYFLAQVEGADNVNNSIVIFDDPYHNQDRSRRQCTIEKVHHLVNLSNQCFVFSHDIEFARAVEKKVSTPAKTFILDPLKNPAILTQSLPSLPSQAYKANYRLLRNYLADSTGQNCRSVITTLRVILEEYIRFRFPICFADNDTLGDMIRKIQNSQNGYLASFRDLVKELENINNYSKCFHHGSSGEVANIIDRGELKTYVERTLKVIHR